MSVPLQTISPAQAAKILGKSRESVVELILVGEIIATDERQPFSTIPRYRIDPSEVDRWRAARLVRPKATAPSQPRRAATKTDPALARMREARRMKRAEKLRTGI